jgi:hypothetical protein
LKIKLRGRYSETIEVTEAESRVTLITLTKYDFQDAFKNGRCTGSGAYTWKGTTLRVKAASRPNISF